jgi:sigma-70-like protein
MLIQENNESTSAPDQNLAVGFRNSLDFSQSGAISPAVAASSNQAEQELMAQIQQRNVRALEIMYDRYAPFALGYAFDLVQDRELAEEVLQEAFWRVWRQAPRMPVRRIAFSAWLFANVAVLAKALPDRPRPLHFHLRE